MALISSRTLAGKYARLIPPPVPKPRRAVFRITKNIHNILQGVARQDQHVSDAEKSAIIDWITDNAKRYWLSNGGPLCRPEQGGADVIVVRFLNFFMLRPSIDAASVD